LEDDHDTFPRRHILLIYKQRVKLLRPRHHRWRIASSRELAKISMLTWQKPFDMGGRSL